MITLRLAASATDFSWAQEQVRQHHYLGAAVDRRSRPLAYLARLASGERVGCLIFGRPQATCCYRGGLTYGCRTDIADGRAMYDRWEVLNLSRVWFDPRVQAGGQLCEPQHVPGFVDRHGTFRSALASWAIREAIARVGSDYLLANPPCFVGEPYEICVAMSYCDTERHRGLIYRAAGFKLARRNRLGIETWWTDAVAGLTTAQSQAVEEAAGRCRRASKIRERRVEYEEKFALFGG